ncbi:hypothetical protein [Leptospira santarosai]|uniref:Uncharacterized protein n=1 Tax=Leptospira santarosai serovar Arenal str. MAVJ 401 TaxID=1049976 RepID=M6JNP9_9LEPT|nr:hypothetical protein [Leptospira santarosai]EMM78812.1 hypothetical protein LEP1GSC040_2114 [Leptospira santarosai str. 2000030832]EMN23351.1 hypothetical protein LEP1GSC063_0858 [Leptospira santarosai serovar Arenal str. MAVJ 401]MDI7190740.1 hypothetical protein [Leptospira santarosai]MDI7206693.1 hypothetical protein [Leptospira santarosai]MDI7208949.1 hypothetical protein [Leptospira santarosai]
MGGNSAALLYGSQSETTRIFREISPYQKIILFHNYFLPAICRNYDKHISASFLEQKNPTSLNKNETGFCDVCAYADYFTEV